MQEKLMRAAEAGELNAAMAALDGGADVNLPDPQRGCALHVAAREGHAEVVALLLARGASPDPIHYTRAPLSVACAFRMIKQLRLNEAHRHEARYLATVDALLRGGADPNLSPPNDRYAPAHVAIESGTPALLDRLLEAGARLKPEWLATAIAHDAHAAIPLFIARFGAKLELDEALLRLCARDSLRPSTVEALRALVEAGADPKARGPSGETPAHYAAYWTNADLLSALLASGASLDTPTRETWYPEDTPKPRGITPQRLLDESLDWERTLFDSDAALRARWEQLAAARGVSLASWVDSLAGAPQAHEVEVLGRWVATMALCQSDDGDYDALMGDDDGERLEDGEQVTLTLDAAGAFALESAHPVLVSAQGRYVYEAPELMLELLTGEHEGDVQVWRVAVDAGQAQLVYEQRLDYRDDEITWTFTRA